MGQRFCNHPHFHERVNNLDGTGFHQGWCSSDMKICLRSYNDGHTLWIPQPDPVQWTHFNVQSK
jgi:hypothetical protein